MLGIEKTKEEIEIENKTTSEYIALCIPPKREKELVELIMREHANFLKKICSASNNGKDIWTTLDKRYKAYLIWSYNQDCPDLKTSILCRAMGVSEGYFRQLRMLELKEWQIEHVSFIDNMVMDHILAANNTTMDDETYIREYGAEPPRTQLKI